MGSPQTPSPLRGDRKRLFAAFAVMAVALCVFAGMAAATDDTDAADGSDYYGALIGTSKVTFHINLDSLDPSKGLIDSSNVIKTDQKYTGDQNTSRTESWSNMAEGAEIVLPTYFPGTTVALAEVSTYDEDNKKTYAGHYYLSGWSTSANGSDVYNPGDGFVIPKNDVTLYAVWTKIEQSRHSNSIQWADQTVSLAVGDSYNLPVMRGGAAADSNDLMKALIKEAFFPTGEIRLAGLNSLGRPNGYTVHIEAPSNFTHETSGSNLSFVSQNLKAGNYLLTIYDSKAAGTYVWWLVSVEDPLASKTYTYSYQSGVSGSSAPTGGTARYGQAFDLSGGARLTNSDSTKVLAGWTIRDGSSTTAKFALGQRIVMYDIVTEAADSNRKVVFRADWEAAAGAVVLSMDGASLRNVTAYSVRQGQTINLPLEALTDSGEGVMKEGKTLIGWNTLTQNTSTNGVALYAPGAPVLIGSSLLKAEAYFWDTDKLNQLCTVSYNYNGGTGTIGSQKVPKENFVCPPMHGISAPAGKEFIGWSDRQNPTEADVINTDIIKVPDYSAYTLYAVYRDTPSPGGDDDDPEDVYHTVSFNLNGGHGGVSAQSVRHDGFAIRPAAWPTGSIWKEGYVLDSWSNQSGSGTEWRFDTDKVTSDLVLKANWIRHFTYTIDPDNKMKVTIKIDSGDSKRTAGSPYDQNFTVDWGDGERSSTTTHVYTGVQTAYRITVTSQLSESVSVSSYRTLTGLEGEIDPQPINVVVTFFAGTGEFSDGAARKTVTIEKGGKIAKPETPDMIPVADGKTFRTWTRNGIDFDFDTSIQTNITLTASYTDVYKVTFDRNYTGAEPMELMRVEAGKSISLPSPGTRDGWSMKGWFTRSDGYGTSVGDPGASYTPTRDIILYAAWSEIKQDEKVEVTVSFDTGSGAPVKEMTIEKGKSIELPDSTWSGHKLSRWYLGSEPVGAPRESFTPHESCELRAVWLDNESGKEVNPEPGDVLVPEAVIVIDTTDKGWTLRGSGTNAQSFVWSISKDGGLTWSRLGVGKTLDLYKDDYQKPGTYRVKLTTTSATSHTSTSTDFFIVSADNPNDPKDPVDPAPEQEKDKGLWEKVTRFFSENTWALVLLIIGLAVAVFCLRWFI